MSAPTEDSDSGAPPCRKRCRYLDGWEAALLRSRHGKFLGLSDLFAERPRRGTTPDTSASSRAAAGTTKDSSANGSSFYTLRLEHRQGGVMARHPGEERILLFRSDRPGAIAKIVYSSSPPPLRSSSDDEASRMAKATIHVLDVKEGYRGFDLGGLLFTEALASLSHRYMENSKDNEEADEVSHHPAAWIHCQLDAEEDIQRHNKLVGFYKNLGCQVKPKSKVQYLNNNDGETYRKVPMQIDLKAKQDLDTRNGGTQKATSDAGTLVGCDLGFVPVVLCEAPGKRVSHAVMENQTSGRADWLMMEDESGHYVILRTTKGQYLRANSDGHCDAAVVSENKGEDGGDVHAADNMLSSKFQLIRVSDFAKQGVNASDAQEEEEDESTIPDEARGKALWVLQSASHGTFLTLDSSDHMLHCTKTPAFWQVDRSAFSLTCTDDTPPRLQHYRQQWMKQTVEYVIAMRERYLGFKMARMSLRKALDLAHKVPGYHFGVERGVSASSLRSRCFQTAELFRHEGHPDWVQLLGLAYGIGGIMTLIDMQAAIASEKEYNWTISSRAWVVGCEPPSSVTFGEFRSLNADARDPRYQSLQGMYEPHCGLDNVLLAWTGPEYMYHMLRHNNVNLPEEGLKMLRLASLYDWHSNDKYQQFADDEDQEIKSFVADFDEAIQVARDEVRRGVELTTDECDRLWNTHYSTIASKYGMIGDLDW